MPFCGFSGNLSPAVLITSLRNDAAQRRVMARYSQPWFSAHLTIENKETNDPLSTQLRIKEQLVINGWRGEVVNNWFQGRPCVDRVACGLLASLWTLFPGGPRMRRGADPRFSAVTFDPHL